MAQMSLMFGAGLVAALAEEAVVDPGWNLRVTNSEGPVSRTCYDAEALPSHVRGSYFIAGPAQFDGGAEGKWRYQGIFDGLGMVNRFELHPDDQPGKVCYTSEWMNTGMYQNFAKDHKTPPRGVLFEDTDPPRSSCSFFTDMCDYQAPNDNNWVNMIPVGDEALWLSDTPTIVVMNPTTLNVTGRKVWANDQKSFTGMMQPSWVKSSHMTSGSSAHPLPRPGQDGVYVDFLLSQPMSPFSHDYIIDIVTFEATRSGPQNRRKISTFTTDASFYMHSFGLTRNYAVFPLNMVMGGVGPMHTAVVLGKFQEDWKGVHIVDLERGAVTVFKDMTPFQHAHISNTFENASGIVFDVGAYDKTPFVKSAAMDVKLFKDKQARDVKGNFGALRRYHFNNVTKSTTVQHLVTTGREYDFYKINPAFNGLPYCIYYAVEWFHDDKSYASMAIMKHDICHDKITYWSQPNVYLNEPFFLAGNSEAEDDGSLIFTGLDGTTGRSIFVALDAQSFKEIERFELPNHIPFTAHGSFIPAQRSVGATVYV